LVIKLGALGDFIHAFHGFAAIRAHHPNSHITLLTTAPFCAMAAASPWFDEVRVDERPRWWDLPGMQRTQHALRGFDFVYDLQTSARSGRYYRRAGRPPWSGIARGSSHPHANPDRDSMHTLERQREQLHHAGIDHFPPPERDWMVQRGIRHGLTAPYALLVPGGAGAGAPKRWPSTRYAELARRLTGQVTVAIIGGEAEAEAARVILQACPTAIDLTGRTTIEDIAALASGAALVVGNDTGPLQVAAAFGAPALVLMSAVTVREQAAPRGPQGEWASVIQVADLNTLPVARVVDAALELLARPRGSGA